MLYLCKRRDVCHAFRSTCLRALTRMRMSPFAWGAHLTHRIKRGLLHQRQGLDALHLFTYYILLNYINTCKYIRQLECIVMQFIRILLNESFHVAFLKAFRLQRAAHEAMALRRRRTGPLGRSWPGGLRGLLRHRALGHKALGL